MLSACKRFLDGRSPAQVTTLGFAVVALVGMLDHVTGYELAFSIFYLAPIALVTWYTPQWIGFLVCGVCAMVWLVVDYTSGHPYSNGFIPFWNAGVRLGFFVVTSYLLFGLKSHLKHEQTLATTDGLTGLLNARAFKDVSHRLLVLAARYHHPTVLGYVDLDDFKAINDTLGHSEGDRVLQTVATTLIRCVRATDIAGRLGGDEFAILLPETDHADARMIFDRIRDELVRQGREGGRLIGFSVGVAVFPGTPPSIDEALKIADRLMYRAKKAGKGNVIYEEQARFDKDAEQPVPSDGAPRPS